MGGIAVGGENLPGEILDESSTSTEHFWLPDLKFMGNNYEPFIWGIFHKNEIKSKYSVPKFKPVKLRERIQIEKEKIKCPHSPQLKKQYIMHHTDR